MCSVLVEKAGCAKVSPTVPSELLCDPVWAYMYSIYRVYCSLHVHQCPNKSHSSVQEHHSTNK